MQNHPINRILPPVIRAISFIMIGFSSLQGIAQSTAFQEGITWQEQPEPVVLDSSEAAAPAAYLLDFRQYLFRFSEEGTLVTEYSEHNRIQVNTAAAIEEYNKVYIGIGQGGQLKAIRARSVAPDGTVINLDETNIKELDNLENAGAFRIFAIEGLVPGSVLEYAYTLVQEPSFYGRDVFQRDVPVREAVFEILAPSHFTFQTKSYNGFSDAVDSTAGNQRRLRAEQRNLPAALSERYARLTPNLQRVEYILGSNLLTGNDPYFDWGRAAFRYLEAIYTTNKDDDKAIKGLLKDLKLNSLNNHDGAQIMILERYFKDQIALQEGNGDAFESPHLILRNRYANEFGMLRLMANTLLQAGIGHELVVGTERDRFPFDPDFATWSYLEEPFLYFPRYGKFLAPSAYEYRYGLIPFAWTSAQALFIELHMEEGGQKARYRLDSIPEPKMSEHYDNMAVDIRFDPEAGLVELTVERKMSGYRAYFLQPYLERLPKETRDEVASEILLNSSPNATLLSQSFGQATMEDVYMGNPLLIKGTLSSASLLEKAGSRLLFKVGEVIGPQVEMYQIGPRKFDADMEYPHGYRRDLTINLPDGYRCKGLEDLAMSIAYQDEQGRPLMGFVSEYALRGDKLTVSIHEYYARTSYPLAQFEDFRKVINAAADFNKITLVLEPEGNK